MGKIRREALSRVIARDGRKDRDTHPSPRYRASDVIRYWNHCWYCDVELDRTYVGKRNPGRNGFTRDHLEPRSKGGRLIIPACYQCNTTKKSLSLEEFRIVFFGGHGGVFAGEKIEQELIARGELAPDGFRNFAIARAMERWIERNRPGREEPPGRITD